MGRGGLIWTSRSASRAITAEIGTATIRDAAETLLETVEAGPGVFNAVVEKGAKPKFRDKLTELWINWLLSSPATHAVNMTSNTLTALGQIPEHMVAAGLGGVRRLSLATSALLDVLDCLLMSNLALLAVVRSGAEGWFS